MTKEKIAKIIFHLAVGESQWDNPYYADEREGCLNTAEAIADALQRENSKRDADDSAGPTEH